MFCVDRRVVKAWKSYTDELTSEKKQLADDLHGYIVVRRCFHSWKNVSTSEFVCLCVCVCSVCVCLLECVCVCSVFSVYVCVCVCVCVCVHMCVCVHVHTVCVHACMCLHVCAWVCVLCVCLFVGMCVHMHVCVFQTTHIHTLLHNSSYFFLFCLTVTFILTLNVYILIFHLLCFSVQIPHDLPGEACRKALQRADAAQVV